MWSPTQRDRGQEPRQSIFNPRAPCGARHDAQYWGVPQRSFQSTGSVWSPTRRPKGTRTNPGLFNPRAPCGARLCARFRQHQTGIFNPRAPCGARHLTFTLFFMLSIFNPRAPCGARLIASATILASDSFQSTGSVWSPTWNFNRFGW